MTNTQMSSFSQPSFLLQSISKISRGKHQLTGETPFHAKELLASGIDAMRKTIREKEPVRPSTKLSQTLVAADVRRLKSPAADTPGSEEEVRASSRRLLRVKETMTLLKGDLEWIVMRCLEKDRRRRYETATGLTEDIRGHLGNEPVTARPPSTAYRFQKMVRRNKLVFGAAAAVTVALILGVIVSASQAVRATRANAAEFPVPVWLLIRVIRKTFQTHANSGYQEPVT